MWKVNYFSKRFIPDKPNRETFLFPHAWNNEQVYPTTADVAQEAANKVKQFWWRQERNRGWGGLIWEPRSALAHTSVFPGVDKVKTPSGNWLEQQQDPERARWTTPKDANHTVHTSPRGQLDSTTPAELKSTHFYTSATLLLLLLLLLLSPQR